MYNNSWKNRQAQRLLEILVSCDKAYVHVEVEIFRISFDDSLLHERPALFKAIKRFVIAVVGEGTERLYLAEIAISPPSISHVTLIDRLQDYAERNPS